MRCLPAIVACLATLLMTLPGMALISESDSLAVMDADLGDRTISSIRFEGLGRVSEQLIRNNIRSSVGETFDPVMVNEDVHRLTRLGQFKYIDGDSVLLPDGSIELVFVFREQLIVAEIAVVGNDLISDRELLAVVPLRPGMAMDNSLIDRGRRGMAEIYRKRGNYLVEIDVDDAELEESGVLIYRVMEGPRVRVKGVVFEGNRAFTSKELSAEIETSVAILFLRRGELDEDVLRDDVATLDTYYRDRGFLDVRVDRSISLSPDNREAKVTFLVDEGPQYTLGGVSCVRMSSNAAPDVFTVEQIRAMIPLKTGDIYRRSLVDASVATIEDAYGVLGHVDVIVRSTPIHSSAEPVIDLLMQVEEGAVATVGLVRIQGNELTMDKVIRRHARGLRPGRRFDASEIERIRERLISTRIFNDVKVTVLKEGMENPGYRDVLIEVKEADTGSLNFGVSVGTDSGLLGMISLNQRNFDVADVPESWGEFWKGKAFRGAGQDFAMAFQPGDKIFNYQVSLVEPHFLETDYSLGGTVGWRRRDYNDYTEERLYSRIELGRKFGDIWSGAVHIEMDNVRLTDIDNDVPQEIFDDRGPETVMSTGVSLARTTINRLRRPERGSRLDFSFDRFGIPGGDREFNRTTIRSTTYFALDRDFLGRTTTLRLNAGLGYIFDGDSPTYERFYYGGQSFRGFGFRQVSPKGTPRFVGAPADIPVGGSWEAYLGTQVETPLLGDVMTGVVFLDTGTVTDSPGFDEYRVSVGTGLRLYIPQLGQIPIAFDFGFPLRKQPDDDTRVFTFSAELPF
jgi:outer membrane protein insertion porin family